MNAPAHLKYTKTDEWYDPATGKVGLTDYAQSHLSDVVFAEFLVEAGETLEVGKPIASVESVKASAEVYAPAAGSVAELNAAITEKPEILNQDPYGAGWLIRIENGQPASELMDAEAYLKYCQERE